LAERHFSQRGRTGLPVGAAQQEQMMDRFQMPIMADQLRSQPIEQLGMAGSIAIVPKIICVFTMPWPK